MMSLVGRGDSPPTRSHALSATRGCEGDPGSNRERDMQRACIAEGNHLAHHSMM